MGTTKFDLIAHSDAIHAPWGFLALFWAASVVVVVIAVLAWRFRWKRWRRGYFTVFAVIWCGGIGAVTWFEISLAHMARTAAQNGNFRALHGCLSRFHAGKPYASKTIDADEVWTLGGESFEYGAGGVGFAYRTVEPLGGVIHADTYVDVAFVRNVAYHRNEILRLTVTPHACPRALDQGPP
jgi:hypothetical protein